tara:strand:- start:2203 stop:3348 length:1146 start_codon:yes stop_codon:yes gene_type:complete
MSDEIKILSQEEAVQYALNETYRGTGFEQGRTYTSINYDDIFNKRNELNELLRDQKRGSKDTSAHQYEIRYAPPVDMSDNTPKMIYRPMVRKTGQTTAKKGVIDRRFVSVGAVAFPLPQGIVDMVKPQWEQKPSQWKGAAMAVGGKAKANGAALDVTGGGNHKGTLGQRAKAFFDIGKHLTSLGANTRALAGQIGLGVGSEASKQLGSIVNKHEESYFQGMEFRNWSFTHRMTARSLEESRELTQVVDFLQKWASPRYRNGGTHIEYPAEFRIHFLHNGVDNLSLPIINQCVCEGIDVNYSPDGNQFFESGAPTTAEIVINMKEAVLRTRDHIVQNEMSLRQQTNSVQTMRAGGAPIRGSNPRNTRGLNYRPEEFKEKKGN